MLRRDFFRAVLVTLVGAGLVSAEVEAKRGRPASPRSVGGTRRRTRRRRTRRRIRRGQRLYSLPYGCSTRRLRGGVNYYYCGGIWYQPAYQGTTVVYIVETVDAGASTDVEFEEEEYY
ncbi:MAG: hypothetical protein V7742_05610 [Halioglobus sp.]|jgi:hypothetical protein